MSREEIKDKIRKAVEGGPFKEDIQKVSVFGSYIHGDFKDSSDVDVLIEFTPSARVGFFRLVEIQREMERLVGKKVDLLTPESLSKYFREEVIAEADLVYEKNEIYIQHILEAINKIENILKVKITILSPKKIL